MCHTPQKENFFFEFGGLSEIIDQNMDFFRCLLIKRRPSGAFINSIDPSFKYSLSNIFVQLLGDCLTCKLSWQNEKKLTIFYNKLNLDAIFPNEIEVR